MTGVGSSEEGSSAAPGNPPPELPVFQVADRVGLPYMAEEPLTWTSEELYPEAEATTWAT